MLGTANPHPERDNVGSNPILVFSHSLIGMWIETHNTSKILESVVWGLAQW